MQSKLYPKFAKGQRIRLVSMGPDPRPMKVGSTGIIESIADFGDWTQVKVQWDADVEHGLLLCLPNDQIEIVEV